MCEDGAKGEICTSGIIDATVWCRIAVDWHRYYILYDCLPNMAVMLGYEGGGWHYVYVCYCIMRYYLRVSFCSVFVI